MLIPRIIITGGPCSGKTTCLGRMTDAFEKRGIRVFIVPEAASLIFSHGASVKDFHNQRSVTAFQSFVFQLQKTLEDSMVRYAETTNEPSIIICDRGAMDGSAYVDEAEFQSLLYDFNTDVMQSRDCRYDAALHLVTAAWGPHSEYYTLANNDARTESIEDAIKVDLRLQEVWTGHLNHVVIGTQESFDVKMEKLEEYIAHVVLLENPPCLPFSFPREYSISSIPKFGSSPKSFRNRSIPLLHSVGGILSRDFPLLDKQRIESISLLERMSKDSIAASKTYHISLAFKCGETCKRTILRCIPQSALSEYLEHGDTTTEDIVYDSVFFVCECNSFEFRKSLRVKDHACTDQEFLLISYSFEVSDLPQSLLDCDPKALSCSHSKSIM